MVYLFAFADMQVRLLSLLKITNMLIQIISSFYSTKEEHIEFI